MTQVALLVLAITAGCNCILPEIRGGISHILEDSYAHGQTGQDERMLVEPQEQPEEDTFHQETNNFAAAVQSMDLMNNIDHGCMTEEDCGTGRYCSDDLQNSKCRPCKGIDVSCARDEECCGEQLCVWGQCSPNATKGEAGSTCQYQSDCGADLCCALHKALLFAVCSAKPVERERCLGVSNHLVELLSWDVQQGEGPLKHCPCVGNLRCQHLGRGSMCLKGEDASEEDLTDTLYTEIDYII